MQITSATVPLSASIILIVGFKAIFSNQLCKEEELGNYWIFAREWAAE
jgi:hypothetical protein